MSPSARLLLGFWAAGLIYAQSVDSLSISGSVFELGSDGAATLAVAGAEVSLIEFVLVDGSPTRSPAATAYTDARGAYQFHPQHAGDYYVEVKKEGYRYAMPSFYGVPVKLDQSHPTAKSTFTLMRPGASITGRVVDEDGQPVPDLNLVVQGSVGLRVPGVIMGGDVTAVTAADGTFSAADLSPGPHVIRISPHDRYQAKVEPHFSTDDLNTVDQDLETTYWPGGAAQPIASIPLGPGSSTTAGTIEIRKTPYYRVHVSVQRVECEAGEKWTFSAVYSGEATFTKSNQIPCTGDFLVSNLRPGTYAFRLNRVSPEPRKWALASVVVANKNSEVALSFEPEAQIHGRFIAFDGASLPPFNKIQVLARSEGPSASQPASPDSEGNFVLTNLAFPRHSILIEGLAPKYYVKEVRLNGGPVPDAIVTLAAAANHMEIAIDDKPGAITGTVIDGDKPVAEAMVRLFPKGPQLGIFDRNIRTDKQGRFQINGVPPGEYHILALSSETGSQPVGFAKVVALAAGAQSVTLERGGTVNVTLQVADPSH
jgi:hypothetical protein